MNEITKKFAQFKHIGIISRTFTPHNFQVVTVRIHGPDDVYYAKSHDLWEALPRGYSIVLDNQGKEITSVQGVRKFGYFDDHLKLPYGNFENVAQVQAMEKENGENAQVSAFRFGEEMFWVAGSKNVHFVFQTLEDLKSEEFKDERYKYALPIATWVLENASSKFQNWLADNKYTAVGEAIFSESQHLVDYKQFGDHIRFFAVTSAECAAGKLTCIPPSDALDMFKSFGFVVPELSVGTPVKSPLFKELLESISHKQNSEGCVLYGMSPDGKVQYMCKVKSIPYVLERIVRQATLRQLGPQAIRKAVQTKGAQIFTAPSEVEAVDKWIATRLDKLIDFSGWIQMSGLLSDKDAVQRRWISLQHDFESLETKPSVTWSEASGKSQSFIVAARGLPCSGKSSAMRALQVLLKNIGHSAVWINQDEVGHRGAYLRAVKRSMSLNPNFILLDKSNISAQNIEDVAEVLGGPVDLVLNFVHPGDADGELDKTKEMCRERFKNRKDAHRSLKQDANIDMILNSMASLDVSREKILRNCLNFQNIDFTASKVDILLQCFKTVLSDAPVPSTLELLEAINTSQEYEDHLGQEGRKISYFALFVAQEFDPVLEQVPKDWLKDKTLEKNFHMTISFQGDIVYPKLYLKLSNLLKNSPQAKVTIKGFARDSKIIAAKVEIDDKTLKSENSHPHITIATSPGVHSSYSNQMLASDHQYVELKEPIEISTVLRGSFGDLKQAQTSRKKCAGNLEVSPTVKPMKIASDIGGVIYMTSRTEFEEHVINEETIVIDSSIESLRRLKESGYDVYLLSYCGLETERKTRKKLVEDGVPQIVPFKQWLFCRDRMDKPKLMKEHGIELLIDDRKDTIDACRANGLKAIWFGIEAEIWSEVLEKIEMQNK